MLLLVGGVSLMHKYMFKVVYICWAEGRLLLVTCGGNIVDF